uniref:C2 domain containing 3 centriole elongation regulator n=1 Tax=Astyanax mexicanus TaxID=7994 RepID=W5K8W3_ASTMX
MKKKKLQSVRSGRRVISDVSPSTSVPPLVEGQVRCFLRVTVSRVLWTINRPPPVTLVRLRWWGESSGGTVFCPRDGSLTRQKDVKSTCRFPVRCGPKQFTSYLTDMGSLVLDVLTKPDHLPIARVQIAGIARLSLSHSINGFFTLVSPTSEKLGELQVALALEPLTETYDSSGSVPTTDMSTDAAVPAPGLISDQGLLAPPLVQLGPSKIGRESVEGSSSSTPRGKDHLYFQERGVPIRSRSPLKPDNISTHQKLHSYGSRSGIEPSLNTDNNPGVHMPSGDSRASVDLLSVLLERGSKLRNAMVVSALKSDTDCDVLKDTPLPLPRDNIGISPLSPPVPSSGQLLQNILHSDLHNSSQDPDHLRPEGTIDTHDVAVDLLLGSVNGSVLPIWDGDGSPQGSLSGCSSVMMDSELGDPQFDQSLLENLFYKASRADSCLSEKEEDTQKKPSSEKNNRLDSGVGQHVGAESVFSGLSVDRIACLGSIHVARVVILQLTVPTDSVSNTARKLSGKGKPPRPLTSKKCSYFVEYLFPLPLTDDKTGLAVPAEVTRVVSSKVVDGVVNFQQRTVFPVHFSGPTIKQWWDTSLTFKIFCRKSYQKKPVPVGVAKFPLRTILQSDRLSITTAIPIQKLDVDSDKEDIGPLKVSLELAADKKEFSSKSRSGKTTLSPAASPRKAPLPEVDISPDPQGEGPSGDFPPVFEFDSRRGPSPLTVPPPQNILMPRIRSRSSSPRSRVQNSPHKTPQSADEDERELLLHTLLVVPDGKDFSCAPMQPNVYLNCKLFGSEETTRSVVSWGQTHPTFNLVQVAPVALNSRLLERMKNNVMIIEVWLRAGSSHNDKLLGLVKLPLHQFYMSFRDPKISQLLLKSQYPVLAVDSYMPVVDIFTGGTRGRLRVCLAMGLSQQITSLQRMRDEELASVSQIPRPAHLLDHRPVPEIKANAAPATALNEHVFVVRVEKVRGLTPLQSTVWGEADCYIHYSFPAQEDDARQDVDPHVVESSVNLKSYRTVTTLCVPDLVFGHSETHVLVASPAVPVQRLLLSSLASQGPSAVGGIPFEVWCRYYYPNVREQLVARGVLPMAKLCAMVTMQRQGQTEAQLFSLPLIPRTDRPSDVQPQPSGLLEVSVQYRTRPVRGTGVSSGALASRMVNLVVQVHRAAGLQAAARAAALQYYSEVGVNCFVTIQLSLLSERESRSTRVVARSFSPEFEYHAEFCCQMLVQRDTGESVSLVELLEDAVAVFTVYNRDTRKGVGASTPKDAVLGSVRIRLADLLHKRTGISGWYGLSLPPSASSHCNLTTVGGLELSIHFSHHADRERVLSSARLLGWQDKGDDGEEKEEDKEEGDLGSERWQSLGLSVSMPRAWLPTHCLLLPGHTELQRSTYCYYRYKLYDQDTFCSQLRHPILEAIEEEESGRADLDSGIATVAFPGNQTAELRGSQPLLWYLREERLEVQLWVSFGKGKRTRPHDSDRLVGSAFLDLSTLTIASKQKLTISGVYPLFKRSAADLGGAALRAHITATTGSACLPAPALPEEEEQVSSPGEEEEDQVPLSRLSRSADGVSRWCRVPSRQPTKSTIISEPQPPSRGAELSEEETFTARISVERAMHLSLKGCPLAERSGSLPSCCVSYAVADSSATLSTDVVQDSDCPVWDHHQECRLSKELLVDPQQALVFKVWHKGELERVIGFASVDLSPLLSGFQSVSGWYNITDFSGQCQGQIKVSVSPLTGVQELRPQRLALCENTNTDSSSLFSALPLCYQTTAVYSSFPSHITRFPEQRISSPSDILLSARSSVADRHDEHMDNVRRFHHALQEGESAPLPSGAGDAHPSSSVLFSALRKNLSELDDIQKYFSRKLATPVFSGMGEQGRDTRQEQHRDSETDTAQLLLKSNKLVGEVNSIIKGLGTRQTEPASSNSQLNPSTPPQREVHVFSGVIGLTLAESDSCDTEGCSPKEPERKLEDISTYTSPAAEQLSQSPVPEDEDIHQDNSSSEEENGHKEVNDAEEEDEEFEETLVEPRPLNEVTSITDRTSPWTSVLSDPDLGSLESLEVEEPPLWHSQNITQEKKRNSSGFLPAAPSQHLPSQRNDDSDYSDGFESIEEIEAVKDVQSDSEEHSEEQEPWAAGLHQNSSQGTKQVGDHGQHDTSEDDDDDDDDEVEDKDDSPLPLSSGSSTKENHNENDENKTNLCEDIEMPNFFLPSHHLEASMRAIRLAPVFPSVFSDPDVKSAAQHRHVTRPRLNLHSSSANREETKRIAKIFASHFTEEC